MTQTSANPSFINNSARCAHIFANGRRCRLYSTDVDSRFCPSHARLPQNQPDSADLAAALTTGLDDLTSGEDIATFLSRLLLLTAQGKITPRRAAVLTYIASQLLHSVRTIIAEDKHGPTSEIIFDAPRPERPALDQRDRPPAPDAAASGSSSTFTLPLNPKTKASS